MGGIEETDFGHLVGKVEGRAEEVHQVSKGGGKAGKEIQRGHYSVSGSVWADVSE